MKGAASTIRKLQQLPTAMRGDIGKALAISLVEMDAYAKHKISGGGRSGRVYRRRSVQHQASAPGEFPKTDRGQLVASLFFRLGADKLSGFFGTMLNYGRYLEYGTSRMLPRPWLRPTFMANKDKISERVQAAIKRTLAKVANG